MSEIDAYTHTCLGVVTCPSPYPLVFGNPHQRLIPIYRLDEDAGDAVSWQAKQGDLLLGGGSGEVAALRIALPEVLFVFTGAEADAPESRDDLYHAYWRMTDAYIFGAGYRRLGWTPTTALETWLVEHILAFIVQRYPQVYRPLCGPDPLELDGSICRLPTGEEQDL